MPKSEKSSRGLAVAISSCGRPTAAKIGVRCTEIGAGLAVCATTQIEHDAASVWLG